jgi:hypothetical protein
MGCRRSNATVRYATDVTPAPILVVRERDPHRDQDYWQEAQKSTEAISNKVGAVCEAIRQRISASVS